MKIYNSNKAFSDAFLRRMTSWCAKQIGMPVNYLKRAVFRNSRTAFGGCARQWCSQITVCVGNKSQFPVACESHYRQGEKFVDQIEAVVAVTAHELFHIEAGRLGSPHYQSTRGYGRRRGHSSEAVTCKEELRVLDLFRQQRDWLMCHWLTEPVELTEMPQPTLIDRRKAKVESDLLRWQRKLKLAKTKVRKLEQSLARYQKVQQRPPTLRKAREKKPSVFMLAEQHGIKVDNHVNRGEWWVYPPPELDSEDRDPHWHDGHLAYDRRELRKRVEEYIKLKGQPV